MTVARSVAKLTLACTPAQLDALRAANAVQRECGLVEARLLESAEIAGVNPAVRGGFAGAAFCPTDGVADPQAVTRELVRRAAELGVEVRERTAAASLVARADAVVVACGAWSTTLARTPSPAGCSMRNTATRRT